jgi:hypothetical protein
VGKAYSPEEKASLLEATKGAKRSKSIHLATMLAKHAGMTDKEIRTLQWWGFDLVNQIITMGQSKTDAGTGRTIPMNDDLLAAAVEYAKWYVERFKATEPDWYIFPFASPDHMTRRGRRLP